MPRSRRGRGYRGPGVTLASAALLLLDFGVGVATPRYALRVGQSCILCHQDPSGGGQRSAYATAYLVPERLARPRPEGAPRVNPQITPEVLLGADLRTFWLDREDRDDHNNFVQMQGSVYLSLQPDPRLLGYVHEEFGQGAASAPEVFALAWLAPGQIWAKAGRFVPAFGWRPADHRTFTRTSFVIFPENPPQSDTGLELGARRGPFELQLSMTNGEFASPFELNDELAFWARGAALRSLGPVNAAAGASYAQHRGTGLHRWTGGPFAGAAYGRLAWWGELDWTHTVRPDPAGGPPLDVRTGITASHELAVRLVQGVDLVATWDFHDPDVRTASGAGRRVGLGIDALLWPFLEVRAKDNRFTRDPGPDAPALPDGVNQAELEIHFLY